MSKTKNADAFRDFKSDKFFQRRLFKKFNFPNKSDDEILEMLTPTSDLSTQQIKQKVYTIRELRNFTIWYIERLEKHTKRLVKFKITFKTEIDRANRLKINNTLVQASAILLKSEFDEIIQSSTNLLCESTKVSLADNLKKLRKHKGYSKTDIANFCGLTLNGYRQYENYQKIPPLDRILRICVFLNVTIDELLGLK